MKQTHTCVSSVRTLFFVDIKIVASTEINHQVDVEKKAESGVGEICVKIEPIEGEPQKCLGVTLKLQISSKSE